MVTGVLSSFFAWWILHHAMKPKIKIDNNIYKQNTKSSKTGFYYQIKYENIKKRSSAVDVTARVSLYLRDFPREGFTNIYNIPLSGAQVFELMPKKRKAIGNNRYIDLKINDIKFKEQIQQKYMPKRIQDLAEEQRLTVEDLLGVAKKSFVRIYITATDAFSGSKKTFKSKDLTIDTIVHGKFTKTGFMYKTSKNQPVSVKNQMHMKKIRLDLL